MPLAVCTATSDVRSVALREGETDAVAATTVGMLDEDAEPEIETLPLNSGGSDAAEVDVWLGDCDTVPLRLTD